MNINSLSSTLQPAVQQTNQFGAKECICSSVSAVCWPVTIPLTIIATIGTFCTVGCCISNRAVETAKEIGRWDCVAAGTQGLKSGTDLPGINPWTFCILISKEGRNNTFPQRPPQQQMV